MSIIKTGIVLAEIVQKSSLEIIRQCEFIYASNTILNKLSMQRLNTKTTIHEIYFDALNEREIDFDDLFFALATFGEMPLFLIGHEKQINIAHAAKIIQMPHIRKLSITLDNSALSKSMREIGKIEATLARAGIQTVIKNGKDQVVNLDDNIGRHKTITLDLRKNDD